MFTTPKTRLFSSELINGLLWIIGFRKAINESSFLRPPATKQKISLPRDTRHLTQLNNLYYTNTLSRGNKWQLILQYCVLVEITSAFQSAITNSFSNDFRTLYWRTFTLIGKSRPDGYPAMAGNVEHLAPFVDWTQWILSNRWPHILFTAASRPR